MEKKVSVGLVDILILFFNKVDQTIHCINSFLPSGQHIYVLNNGSDEQQLQKLKRQFCNNTQVHIMDAGKNLGVSAGRNFLIQSTTAPWLFSVDNDITVKPQQNWLQLFQQFTEANKAVKIVCPHMYNVHDQEYALQLQVHMRDGVVSVDTGSFATTNCFPGGASIIHRSVFETYGLFDEDMFVGFEDYEYALRAMLSSHGSLRTYHIKEIELIHDHRFQKSSSDKAAVRQRYNEERLKASYERMVARYNIVFDHDWQWWTRKQVQDMTERKWTHHIKAVIKKMLGR